MHKKVPHDNIVKEDFHLSVSDHMTLILVKAIRCETDMTQCEIIQHMFSCVIVQMLLAVNVTKPTVVSAEKLCNLIYHVNNMIVDSSIVKPLFTVNMSPKTIFNQLLGLSVDTKGHQGSVLVRRVIEVQVSE